MFRSQVDLLRCKSQSQVEASGTVSETSDSEGVGGSLCSGVRERVLSASASSSSL